jgi:hypothetical protein
LCMYIFFLLRSVSDSVEKTLTKNVRITVSRNSIQFSNIMLDVLNKKPPQGGQSKTIEVLLSPQF